MYEPKTEVKTSPVPLDPRVHKKCEAALTRAISDFPDLLARCEPDRAAAIVAALIRAVMSRTQDVEQQDPLFAVMNRLTEMEERREEAERVENERLASPHCPQSP